MTEALMSKGPRGESGISLYVFLVEFAATDGVEQRGREDPPIVRRVRFRLKIRLSEVQCGSASCKTATTVSPFQVMSFFVRLKKCVNIFSAQDDYASWGLVRSASCWESELINPRALRAHAGSARGANPPSNAVFPDWLSRPAPDYRGCHSATIVWRGDQ